MAMVKIVSPGGWDFDGPIARLVKVGRDGRLGANDRRELLKVAAHAFVDDLANIKLAAGEVPVHAIALGAHEGYGCFFAGTPVQTEFGLRPIEDIYVGAQVLTHANRLRPVTHVFKRAYSGRRATLRISGLPLPLVSTGNHPYWVVRKREFAVQHRCPCYLDKSGKTKEVAVAEAVAERAEFVRADTIRPGDFMIVPVGCATEQTALPSDEAYLLGVYLAEGCIVRRYGRGPNAGLRGIVLAVNSTTDGPMIDAVNDIVTSWGYRVGVRPSNSSPEGLRLEIACRSLAARCRGLFGRTAGSKHIDLRVFGQTREWKLQFLAGYFDGDGCVAVTGKQRYRGVLRANTASLNLALDLQRLLASIDVISSVSRSHNREANGCFGVGDLPIYEISIGSAYSAPVLDYCHRLQRPCTPPRRKQGAGHTSLEYLLLPVKKVVLDRVVNTVKYNLEVEEDNTYVTSIICHNSNRNGDSFRADACRDYAHTFEKYAFAFRNHQNKKANGDPHYGTIKKAVYNEAMRRVELLVAYNGTKEAAERNQGLVADKELEKLARGEDLAGSMACRVSHDVCSFCGNKARTRDDYCTTDMCKAGGCKDNLTRIIKVGNDIHQLGVFNPAPHWFDWSMVFRPADRIAYGNRADWLDKTAADGWAGVVGGAKLAEDLGIMAPLAVLLAQDRAVLPTALDVLVKLAYGLDALEQRSDLALPGAVQLAFDSRVQSDFPVDKLGEPGTRKCAEALTALADNWIVLPLRDYARLTGKTTFTEKAAACLGGVYGRMSADGTLEKRLAQNPLSPWAEEKLAAYAVRTWAARLAPMFALEKDAVANRAYLAAVRGCQVSNTGIWIKAASAEPAVEELARTYACYKAAALHRIAALERDFLLTAQLGIAQNHVI